MKKYTKRLGALMIAVLMVGSLTVGAEEADATETKSGNGGYTIEVYNGEDTGITIVNDWFHAYQIFSADDSTTYAVTDAFKDFFVGTMTAGDGSGKIFDFTTKLTLMGRDDPDVVATATDEYNQMAGLYMESYTNDTYALATQIRNYLNSYGAYNDGGTVECVAHSQAVETSSGTEVATLSGLDTGYYFIMDQESTMSGLGIAASGAFVAITGTSNPITTVKVKDSFPTVDKFIYHDDLEVNGVIGAGDNVGDHQIGDTVKFMLKSTLPSNIDAYEDGYTYTLTDEMSDGLTYDGNAALYDSNTFENEISRAYWSVETDENGFTLSVDVKALMASGYSGALYTHYTATLNSDAVVAPDADDNKVTLEYSNSPDDYTKTGTSEDTVFHYTFSLDVTKYDEGLQPLAGATFALYDSSGAQIKLSYKYTDDEGVDYYYPDSTNTEDGTIVTTETGLFQIYGLNDATSYILRETEAPEGYNAMDDMTFSFTVNYNDMGTSITSLTSSNAGISTTVNSEEVSAYTTIINRKVVVLPDTGGTGTVLLQVGGGVLMLGAAAALLLSKRKKAK